MACLMARASVITGSVFSGKVLIVLFSQQFLRDTQYGQNVTEESDFLSQPLSDVRIHDVFEIPSHEEINFMNARGGYLQRIRSHAGGDERNLQQSTRKFLNLPRDLEHWNLA